MTWTIEEPPERIDEPDGISYRWTLTREGQDHRMYSQGTDLEQARARIEQLLNDDPLPDVLTYPIAFKLNDRVEYVGDPQAPEDLDPEFPGPPVPGELWTVIDINEYAGEVVVSWDTATTLVHGRPEKDLRPA